MKGQFDVDKLQYDSLYKFLVSLGVVLIALPITAFIFLSNSAALIISQSEYEALSEYSIHDLEQRLRQGKLSFASEQRMEKWLGLKPGSVSPFGLVNDVENHVHLFLDANLQKESSLSFHPNDNTGTVVISQEMFQKYLQEVGNTYEYIELY